METDLGPFARVIQLTRTGPEERWAASSCVCVVWLLKMEKHMRWSHYLGQPQSKATHSEDVIWHHSVGEHTDYWGQDSYSVGYWYGQRDKWRCLSGAIGQHNSSCLLLAFKGRVKNNEIQFCTLQSLHECIKSGASLRATTSWNLALKMIPRASGVFVFLVVHS